MNEREHYGYELFKAHCERQIKTMGRFGRTNRRSGGHDYDRADFEGRWKRLLESLRDYWCDLAESLRAAPAPKSPGEEMAEELYAAAFPGSPRCSAKHLTAAYHRMAEFVISKGAKLDVKA